MKQYPIYLLDADDTLFDFQKAERHAFQKTFEAMTGEACTEAAYACYNAINSAMWKALERGELTKPQLQQRRFGVFLEKQGMTGDGVRWNEAYLDRLAEGNFLFEGAAEVCRKLSERASLYLATNGITRVQKKRLRDSEIAPYIQEIFVSEEAGAEKPSSVYFEYVLKQIGNPPKSNVLMVGDSLTSDMAGGYAAGIDTCWYNPSRKPLPPDRFVTWEISGLFQLLSTEEGNNC
ncbi:MAG: YjjG family noncanonical pyrimidine nucleotidase [Candidatus Merdivicinus sp.]|jgi:2-haloacid dehalogenase